MLLPLNLVIPNEPLTTSFETKSPLPRKKASSTAQHSTAQHSTAQHSTAQHSTASTINTNQHQPTPNPLALSVDSFLLKIPFFYLYSKANAINLILKPLLRLFEITQEGGAIS